LSTLLPNDGLVCHAVSARLRRAKSKHVSTIDMPFPLKFSKSGVLDEVPEGSTFMSEDIDLRRRSGLVVSASDCDVRGTPRPVVSSRRPLPWARAAHLYCCEPSLAFFRGR